jgi:hypothetical protein
MQFVIIEESVMDHGKFRDLEDLLLKGRIYYLERLFC